ncbi:hypothetical protein NL676_034259 [Syzygium grande]|nr:hypothetical protein NL676_034259 [Syzygium grande]
MSKRQHYLLGPPGRTTARSLSDDLFFRGSPPTPTPFHQASVAAERERPAEEAKMIGDAKEPDTELQLQFHPSASSRDHEIREEPPIDNVREGTPPGK